MTQKNITVETKLISSLEKVFADEPLKADTYNKGTALNNEVYSFQVAFTTTGP